MINSIDLFKKIKDRYLEFILTTVARENEELYFQLKELFSNEKLFFTDIYTQKAAEYLKLPIEEIKSVGFANSFSEILVNQYLTSSRKPYKHQIEAWKLALTNKNFVVATGTGSGKTEAFLMPIINHCILNKLSGIQAIIVYPLRALAKNQGERIGEMLDNINSKLNTNINYVIFDSDLDKRFKQKNSTHNSELTSKQQAIESPPNILLTNYVMLERIMTNPSYFKMLNNSSIKFIVLDEIHYYKGAQGIDVSLLMRRINYQLKNTLDTKNIQYIGTSATLGNPKHESTSLFLERLFGVKFDLENIISPEYTPGFELEKYAKPTKIDLTNEEEIKNLLNESDLKVHAFFSAPPDVYRCNNCNNLQSLGGKCKNCESKVSKVVTCRQCGTEYFIYEYEYPKKRELDIESIKFNPLNPASPNSTNTAEIVLSKSKDNLGKYAKKMYICKNKDCQKLLHGNQTKCTCENTDLMEVYTIDDPLESFALKQDTSNNKFCPACEFEEKRMNLIVPTSRLSDENCSHVIFDEAFVNLPQENRKFLMFTDNVQRTSKFARELQETHTKNYAKFLLTNEIKNLNKTTVDQVMSNIELKLKKEMPEDLDISQIKTEIYQELLKNRRKVASLSNRGLLSTTITLDEKLTPEEQIIAQNIAGEFFNKCQVYEYHKLESDEDNIKYYSEFEPLEILLRKAYRKRTNEKIKVEQVKTTEEHKVFEKMFNSNMFIESDNKIFLKSWCIEVKSELNKESNIKNYYDTWANGTNTPLMKTSMHTGNLQTDEREKIETQFSNKLLNNMVLIATPTLELGIDIGDLDLIGLLYAPPSPAQYTQRVGRAGRGDRKHQRSSLALTYFSKSPVDSWYFNKPNELVEGKINPPAFTIDIETPLKKSLYASFLFLLLNHKNFMPIMNSEKVMNPDFWRDQISTVQAFYNQHKEDINSELDNYITETFSEFKNRFTSTQIIEEWFTKLIEYNKIQSITGMNRTQFDSLTYLRDAGLLPDYAFGDAGVIITTNEGEKILNFQLMAVCPPSSLDYKKRRFSCKKIVVNKINCLRDELNESLVCTACGNLLYTNIKDNCEICGAPLLDKRIEKIKYPHAVIARKSTFSLKQKYVEWNYSIVDPPALNFEKNKIISKPFQTSVCMTFDNVISEENSEEYFLCERCGEIYLKSEKKSKSGCFHKKADWKIGELMKTRAVLINLSQFSPIPSIITIKNALISAIMIDAGCEDGEINAIELGGNKLVLFDDVKGGVGFVDRLSEDPKKIIEIAKKMCESDCCANGCIKCIGSYWRRNELKRLNKKDPQVIEILGALLKLF
ncbi:MAG: DEAD/DEAH box helicase [Clostridia bacterium]|nr:DEAD/DEAH box helicase [Clostridia bacterium]